MILLCDPVVYSGYWHKRRHAVVRSRCQQPRECVYFLYLYCAPRPQINVFGAQAEVVRLQAATKAALKLDNASEAQMLAAAMRTVDDKLKGMATSTLLQHARCNPPRVEDHVSDWTQDKVLPRLLELLKVLPPTAATTAATHCAVTSPSLVARTVQQSAAERLSHHTRRQ